MKQIKAGVIGLGMGKGHIRGYQSHPNAAVTAIAEIDAARLQEVGDEYGIEARYNSGEELIDSADIDVVSIATPNKFHHPLTIRALKKGLHVLCEKPIAMNAKEGREMVDTARKAGKRLMVNFSYRFHQQSQALKAQIESGILGDIYYGRSVWHRRKGLPRFGGWFGQKALSGGGPLIDLGVHRLDLALWLMGYPKPLWVLGSAYNHLGTSLADAAKVQFDVEDLAAGFITFENGATLEIEASWAGHIKEKELMETRLWGTKAGLVQRNTGEGYSFEAEIYMERQGSQFDMKLHNPSPPGQGAMYHFVDSIVHDTPHTATGEEGVLVISILDAIYASAEQKRPVKPA